MSPDPRWTIARRELAALRSEKTIVLALVIQLFVAGFSSFLIVGLVSMYDPSSIEGGGVDVAVTGEASDDVLDALEAVGGVQAVPFEDAEDARAEFEAGGVDALVEATTREGGRIHVRATVPESGIRSTLAVTRLGDATEILERQRRTALADRLEFEPVDPPEQDAPSPYVGFTYTVLVPLLCFLPVFIGGSIAVDTVSEELERGTLELLRSAPVTLVDIVDGKLLAAAGLAPLQALLWLVLLRLNGIAIANLLALTALVAAVAGAVVALGLGIALVAPDRRQAQLVYSVGVLSAFVVAAVLPEHPANTVAKLAIGSPTATTWALLGGYLVAGTAALLAIRRVVGRLSPDQLGGDR